jgi:enoyl-CoA hydratase/carnithine racemase
MNLVNSVAYIELPKTLSPDSIIELDREWAEIKAENPRLVVLKGRSEDFCLGMDIHWVSKGAGDSFTEAMNLFIAFLQNLQAAPCITMAVVEGRVTGGGVGIVAACDIVIATPNSSFHLTEGLLGLIPGIILTPLLSRLPKQVLAKIVFAAKRCTAEYALSIGLIDDIASNEDLETSVNSWISELKKCKQQAVVDLKILLAKANDPQVDLMAEGAAVLKQRVNDPVIQDRLLNLAFFNEE